MLHKEAVCGGEDGDSCNVADRTDADMIIAGGETGERVLASIKETKGFVVGGDVRDDISGGAGGEGRGLQSESHLEGARRVTF